MMPMTGSSSVKDPLPMKGSSFSKDPTEPIQGPSSLKGFTYTTIYVYYNLVCHISYNRRCRRTMWRFCLPVCLSACLLNPIFDNESIINKPATDDTLL
mmetsp:Transcript_59550/g.66630  ORF Transcript_59550/g.66630 Transcript_59550/m.66630 type:complete len:98 (+) Transcript_59550:598-891(+)